jgi:hypothetical protein
MVPAWLSREALPVWALVAIATLHFLALLATGRTFFAEPDNALQFWPWYQQEAASLHAGALSLWDSHTLAGHSFVGETQTGVFYPLNILWLLLVGSAHGIGPRRLDLLVELHFLIASTGFYALARSFRFRQLPALIAALTFAYTGAVFNRAGGQTAIFFGLTLIPWAAYFAHRQLVTRRLGFSVAAGACVGLALLAGHFEPPFHALLIVLLLYLGTAPADDRRAELRARLSGLVVTALVAVLVAAPQLAYSLPYLGRAYRFVGAGHPVAPGGSVSFNVFVHAFSGGPQSFLSLLDPRAFPVPDANSLYLGLGTVAVLALVSVREPAQLRRRFGRFWWSVVAILVFGVLAMLGPWTFFPRILYFLPLVSQVRELARYSILIQLALCLLLAASLDILGERWSLRRGGRERTVLLLAGGLAALNGLYLWLFPPPGGGSWFGAQLILGGAVCVVLGLAGGFRAGPARHAGGLVLLVPLFILIGLLSGLSGLGRTSSSLYPTRSFALTPALRFVQHSCAAGRTELLDQVFPNNVGDVYRSIHTVNGYGATMQSSLYAFLGQVSPVGPAGVGLLDVRCVATAAPLRNPLFHLAFADYTRGQFVYLDWRTSPVIRADLRPVPVQVLADQDRFHAFRVHLDAPARLYLSEIVYPGWIARIDGHVVPTGYYRARGTPVFPQLSVPAGTHILSYSWSGWPS